MFKRHRKCTFKKKKNPKQGGSILWSLSFCLASILHTSHRILYVKILLDLTMVSLFRVLHESYTYLIRFFMQKSY